MTTRASVRAAILAASWMGMGLGASALGQEKVDLRTKAGVERVQGQWRYHDVKIVEIEEISQPPEREKLRTYSIEPKAGAADFDDKDWEVLDPTTLGRHRAGGRLCFNWYRIRVTLPPESEGKAVHFVTTVDDYGEVWVDGKLDYKVGTSGGAVVAGFNVPNRVELRDAKPGKAYSLAVFGINGPISASPSNRIFLKDTYLEFSEKK